MIKALRTMLIALIIALMHMNINTAIANNNSRGFYDDETKRQRGWLWFEEQERKEEQRNMKIKTLKQQKEQEERKEAREKVEQFKKELEELKYMMIAHPESTKHTKAYKEKEAIMMNDAITLANTARMVSFMHPAMNDLIDNPINLYGRRIHEEINSNKKEEQIRGFAKDVELFVFVSQSCEYCKSFEPILYDFAKKYGFKIEAVSLDGSISKYFKTNKDEGLARVLKLERTPTVVVVTNDSKISFELVRGIASISELEDNSMLAIKYLENINSKNLNRQDYE